MTEFHVHGMTQYLNTPDYNVLLHTWLIYKAPNVDKIVMLRVALHNHGYAFIVNLYCTDLLHNTGQDI